VLVKRARRKKILPRKKVSQARRVRSRARSKAKNRARLKEKIQERIRVIIKAIRKENRAPSRNLPVLERKVQVNQSPRRKIRVRANRRAIRDPLEVKMIAQAPRLLR
jgi:predicted metal-dependent hydrolase